MDRKCANSERVRHEETRLHRLAAITPPTAAK
jgi:hypothetical protein